MPDTKRKIRIATQQRIKDPNGITAEGELPIRSWNIEIYFVPASGEPVPATIFEKVMYELHPSFGKARAKQTRKEAPFRIEEEGWGEFEMIIHLYPIGKGQEIAIPHDLNFQEESYNVEHDIAFKNPKPELLAMFDGLSETAGRRAVPDSGKKRARKEKNVDMEKLADGMQKLGEEDLLHAVQLIHDQKTAETYTKNDVENGEFHVDLYTLPDGLVKQLWDYTCQKVDM